MRQRQFLRSKVKRSERTKTAMPPVKEASHPSRQAKRQVYFKLQLWMWRRRREKCRLGIFKVKKQKNSVLSPCLGLKAQLQKKKIKTTIHQTVNYGNVQLQPSADGSEPGRSEDTIRWQTEPAGLPEAVNGSSCSHLDTDVSTASFSQTPPIAMLPQTTDSNRCEEVQWDTAANPGPRQGIDVGGLSESQNTATPGQDQTPGRDAERKMRENMTTCQTGTSLKTLAKDIHEFLSDFYRTYGSFIPLKKSDVWSHLRSKLNCDFSDRKKLIISEVMRCRGAIILKPAPPLRFVYKKHTLTLDDLLTLADQNWLNDQVMNMYGELIMESSHHKVHFINSFFHRQLMTKGYDGVKRWTKKVDLFSKSLLLVPIHLEVHWCLVAADIIRKKIFFYDSQGNALQKVARNILKYLMTEAKEKKRAAFENGWIVSFDEKVPQQTNENDCGVFVLEYSRCLALTKPLQFSQKDIPKIRKRIYRELCDCKLHEPD